MKNAFPEQLGDKICRNFYCSSRFYRLFSIDEKREKRICYEQYIRPSLIKLSIAFSSFSISYFIVPLQILLNIQELVNYMFDNQYFLTKNTSTLHHV